MLDAIFEIFGKNRFKLIPHTSFYTETRDIIETVTDNDDLDDKCAKLA